VERIVGRERELAAGERLLDGAATGLHAVVLEGDAGIGKSAVWQTLVDRATGLGFRVLSCRPVGAEAKLAFASLADVLEPVVDEGLAALPAPQRSALEVALLRASARGARHDRRAVGTAVCSLLRARAADGPLLVAIDDAQWLDGASAGALAYALRRLETGTARALVSVRTERDGGGDPLDLAGVLGERCTLLELGPLSLSALYHVIRDRLGASFPRPTLRRIAESSGGNPLFALELARALAAHGARPAPGEPLPVPDTLAALLAERIAQQPADVREALLAVASLAEPDTAVVGAALGKRAAAGLETAARSELVTIRGGRVRFTHPLLASTVVSTAAPDARRATHRRLARVVAEPEQQTRQLALAADGPDEAVAARLDASAREANARGAPEVAAELVELARRLTPAGDEEAYARRTLALAEQLFRAGDSDEARRLAEEVIATPGSGTQRARALELVARMLHVTGTSEDAVAHCEAALEATDRDVELEARIHATLALVSWHDFERKREHARLALDLLDALDEPDPTVLGQALMAYAEGEFYTGRGLPHDAVERALALESIAPAPDVADRMTPALGAWLKYEGDFAGARRYLDDARRAALEEGDEGSLPYVVGHLPQLELWTGNWDAAARLAGEHLELAEAAAQPDQRRQALYNVALVHAHRGQVEDACAAANELLREARAVDDRWGESNALSVLGFVDLSRGEPAGAVTHLERNHAIRDELGATEPLRGDADAVEALLELGQVERAERLCDVLTDRARGAGRPTLLAVAACARARVAATTGDLDRAVSELDEALGHHDRVTVPFDLGRTLLIAGQVGRRRGERRAARDALDRARAIFDELGAPLWRDRAETEARRIPIRRAAPTGLTPTEAQVAELAASGKTNREVAQALFMSPRTVEANLARVYRKLGIASRAELGAWASGRPSANP